MVVLFMYSHIICSVCGTGSDDGGDHGGGDGKRKSFKTSSY